MALSLLQHLRESQGANLVGEVTQSYGLSIERATGFINAGLALVVGRLVNINQTQSTTAVLDILENQDSAALWRDADLSIAHKELTGLGGIDETSTLQALNLIAVRSLAEINNLEQTASLGKEGMNELLDGQAEHLQGHFPDWIYTAAGLPTLIGLGIFNAVKESVASLGSVLRHASDSVAEAVSDVAHKASEATTAAVETVSNTASSVVEGTSELVSKTSAATANVLHAASDAAHKSVHTASNFTAKAVKEPTSLFLRLLPWIGLAVIVLFGVLLWKGCQRETVPVVAATVTAPTSLSPETMSLNTGANGELLNCKGTAGNADLQANLTSAVQAQFGPAAQCDIKINATVETSFAGLAGLSEALGAVKAVANTNVKLRGNTVIINGPDPLEIAKLIERLKTLFGTGVTIESAIPLDPTTVAAGELANINPNAVNPDSVIHALNLQVINFAAGSNDIPDANKAVLDKAATLIKAIPHLKITITGHTDSSGDEKSNVALSTTRAKSVVAYLVSQGVAAESLTAKGAGSSQPIADNTTEDGKLKNRRIAFAIEAPTAS
jgi:outer membrane protein OmpA-like peptidoglycan-associated protein